jgi:hypothetical protein
VVELGSMPASRVCACHFLLPKPLSLLDCWSIAAACSISSLSSNQMEHRGENKRWSSSSSSDESIENYRTRKMIQKQHSIK